MDPITRSGQETIINSLFPLFVYSFRSSDELRLSSVLVISVIIMESSQVARFLRKQYSSSLGDEENLHSSSDPIFAKFKAIRDKLNANSTALTSPESISWFYDLNDALTEWRILKDHKSIKRIFSFKDPVAKKRSAIEDTLKGLLETLLEQQNASSSSTTGSQPDSELLLDCYTFYKPHRITYIEDEVTDKLEKVMVDWLLTSVDGFKAIAIYGAGGSGKTALVKNVLKQKTVGDDNFKCIIWACLSRLNFKEEVDDWIIRYLLDRLGLDTDSLLGNVHEDKDWLMEELERRLLNSGNYILVFDGMWYCNKWFTDDFLGKLRKNGGGAVIVTSRRKTVTEQIGESNKLIHLNPPSAYKGSAFFYAKI